MGVLPFRVEGYVRRLQEVLNVDGYPVLRLDSGTRQIFLDQAKLEQSPEEVQALLEKDKRERLY